MYYKYFYILGILCEKKCPQNVYVEKKKYLFMFPPEI